MEDMERRDCQQDLLELVGNEEGEGINAPLIDEYGLFLFFAPCVTCDVIFYRASNTSGRSIPDDDSLIWLIESGESKFTKTADTQIPCC